MALGLEVGLSALRDLGAGELQINGG